MDDEIIWMFDEDDLPGGMIVDNKLKETTRICPRHGGYCTPDCALAFTNHKGTEWMCVEVYKVKGSCDCVNIPRVKWK